MFLDGLIKPRTILITLSLKFNKLLSIKASWDKNEKNTSFNMRFVSNSSFMLGFVLSRYIIKTQPFLINDQHYLTQIHFLIGVLEVCFIGNLKHL